MSVCVRAGDRSLPNFWRTSGLREPDLRFMYSRTADPPKNHPPVWQSDKRLMSMDHL